MKHAELALEGHSGHGATREGVVTPFPAPACPNPDGEAWIDVDAPARARRRAAALARIQRRGTAILRAVGKISPVPAFEPCVQIEIEQEARPRLAPVPSPQSRVEQMLAVEAAKAVPAPAVRLGLITAVLACSTLAWMTVWVLLRFFQ